MTGNSDASKKLKKAATRNFVDTSEIESLLTDGADPTGVNLILLAGGRVALLPDTLKAIDLLLAHGANPNYRNGKLLEIAIGGINPAYIKGDSALLKLLFKYHVDVNSHYGACLQGTINSGRLDTLKELVLHGGKLMLGSNDPIANACSELSNEAMLSYCLAQIKSELSTIEFKKICDEKIAHWMGCATTNDRPDLLALLLKRFTSPPPTDLFSIAAKRFAIKSLDYLIEIGAQGYCNDLLTDVISRAHVNCYREGDDQRIAQVVDKLLSIESSDTAPAIDRHVHLSAIDNLITAGRTHTLEVLITIPSPIGMSNL